MTRLIATFFVVVKNYRGLSDEVIDFAERGQLEEEDKQTIFRLIDKMLTNKKFKDFFNKNVATL